MEHQNFIKQLRSGDRDSCLKMLYRYYPKVKKFILSRGGNREDAEDIFQDALVAFCRKAEDPSFNLTASPETYLFSICRFMWKDELIRRNKFSGSEWKDETELTDESEFTEMLEKESRMKKMESVLLTLGERCLKLLKFFYSMQLSMKVIAQKMDFKSEKIAKNQKYKCLERAREMARSREKDSNLNSLS